MGAAEFCTESTGTDMRQAFAAAVDAAAWLHGHGGYTGSIAEKGDFVDAGMIENGQVAEVYRALLEGDVKAVMKVLRFSEPAAEQVIAVFDDKWGPAVGFEHHQPDNEGRDALRIHGAGERMSPSSQLITVGEAARLLGVTRQRVHELVKLGRLREMRSPTHVYIERASLTERLKANQVSDEWMTTAEVAARFDVATKTVRRWHRAGLLVAEAPHGRALRFDPRQVAKFRPPLLGMADYDKKGTP